MRRYEIPIIGYLTVKLFTQINIRREARDEKKKTEEKHQTRIDCNAIYGATDQKKYSFLYFARRLAFFRWHSWSERNVRTAPVRNDNAERSAGETGVGAMGVRRARERNEN